MNNQGQPGIMVIGTLENSGTTQEHNNRVHSTEGISPTLTAVSGGTHHIKIFDPTNYRVRKLTPTEYGRLQAFPMETWEQVVSDSQAYKQFGNAVTTNVVEAIACALRCVLETDEETPTEQMIKPTETILDEIKGDLEMDGKLEIIVAKQDDRDTIASILFRNGYTVSQKRRKKGNGTNYEYFIEAEQDAANAITR